MSQTPFVIPSAAHQFDHLPADGRGFFVAFEGGDGAGKSTQIGMLTRWLDETDTPHVVTREPGGTPLGAEIRRTLLHGLDMSPRAEALLFAADRAHHVETVVVPALERGVSVVTDRFMDSSIAYQGAGRALGVEEVRALSLWAAGGLLPDLTVLLDVDPHVGRTRRGEVHDRLEAEPDDFHARVRHHFLDLAAAEPARYLVLPATDPADDIAAQVRARVAALPAGPHGRSPR